MSNLYPIDNRLDFGSVLEGDVFARVFVRQRWADAWTERLDIIATQILWAAAPNTGSATIHRRYGPTVDRGDDAPTNRTPLELGGWYVKIVVTCPDGDRLWHGYVIDTGDEPGGLVTIASTTYATGKQTWSCVGMLAALDRRTIEDHLTYTTTPLQDPGKTNRRTVFSPPHFNPAITIYTGQLSTTRQRPNRYTSANVFAANNYTGGAGNIVRHWTRREIVQYLVEHAAPRDELDATVLPIVLFPDTQIPNWGRPDLDCSGRTLKQCLDALLNSANGMGYWAWVDDETNEIIIHPYTTTPTVVTIDPFDPLELPATTNITDLYLGNDPATAHTIQQSLATRYNRIRATGAKRIVVCSREFIDAVWTRGYTDEEVEDWLKEFPSSSTNPLEAQQQQRHALEEGRYAHLFRFFRLSLSQLTENKSAPGTPKPPIFRQDADPAVPYLPARHSLQILFDLPLKKGIDYTAENAATLHRSSLLPQRSIAVYGLQHNFSGSPPANAGHPNDWANRSHTDLWYHTSRPNYEINATPYDDGEHIGIRLDVSGGWQGVLSGSDIPAFINPFPYVPLIDRTSLKITLAIQEDRRCEVLYPDPIDLPDVDTLLELHLDAGDGYRRVDLLKGTIVGYTPTAFQRVDDDIVLEDDTDELWTIARLAYEWYSRPRSIVRLTSRRPTARLWPGVLIRNLNPSVATISREVNTCITEVALSLPTVSGVLTAPPQFEIVTSSGDVDFLRYVPRLRA